MIRIFLLTASIASAATFTGVITDSMCAKDHKPMNMGPDADCTRACVKSSKTVKYALYDGKRTYLLSDQQTPEKYAAKRVKVRGNLVQKTGIIKVEAIEPAR
jgi:hypothetical protein